MPRLAFFAHILSYFFSLQDVHVVSKHNMMNRVCFSSDDKTRVVIEKGVTSDYINASHIQVQVGKDTQHYVACQGPLPNTTTDFWQMVWEQRADVIAMVTLDVESGKVSS